MKKSITKIAFIFFLFLNLSVKAQTGLYVPQLANFDAAMLNLISQYNVPGGELAITYHGRLVYNRGFGYADKTSLTLVQPNNIFRLASVSKPITAITIMHLVEQGLLNLNDTVFGIRGILNDTIYQNILDPRVYNITVRNLLSHSGGWDRNLSGDPMFNSYAIATAMRVTPPANPVTVMQYVLSHQMLDFIPGTQYQYSNFGFCLLGRVIEKVTGKGYEDYVRDTILLPLTITDMHLGFNLLDKQLPMEVTYYDYPGAPNATSVYDNVTPVPWTYGGFNMEAMDAHGAWVASAEDLCKLLVSIDGFSTRPDILLPATIQTMTSSSATNVNYGLGWAVNSNNNWWHNGSLPGTTTEIVRGNNQLNWAILLNTRPYNSMLLSSAVDNLVWKVIPTITSWPTNDLFTGLEEVQNESSITVFPNPSNGEFTITSNGNISSIEIYNGLGEKIYTNYKPNKQTSNIIDLSNSLKGIYLLKIYEGVKICSKKIVIQ